MTTEVRAIIGFIYVVAVVVMVGETFADELLAGITYYGLRREGDFASVQNCLVFQDGLL